MYTQKDLMQQLSAMGLKPDDAVMMHSSMKAIGPVEGGADTVLDALMAYLAPDKVPLISEDCQADSLSVLACCE